MPQVRVPGVVVREELGRGPHSIVYRAERAGCSYAVKVPVGRVAHDQGTARAFAREATVLACIDHPNIIHVRAAGMTEDYPYLIMDVVDGDVLESRIAAGPLGISDTVRIARDVAGALSEAHRRGLVHLDVKPANIMIGPDGGATLLDFGLMARAGRDPGDAAVGTVTYSAPEQTGMLHRPVDARADLYALGAVIYTGLAGAPPFEAGDTAELLRQHAVEAPRPLSDLRTDVPEALASLTARLLAKDPDDRYPSAGAVVAALASLPPDPSGRPVAPVAPTAPLGAAAACAPAKAPGRIIGRRVERGLLGEAWARCLAGERGVVTVSGQAGAGKSVLIEDLLAEHDTATPGAGPVVLRGRCAADASAPLTLLHDLIDGYVRELESRPDPQRHELLATLIGAAGSNASLLARMHPRLADALGVDPVDGGPDADEMRFRSAVVGFLDRLATASDGMIVWVDDAHWLGPADRRVLEDLTAAASSAPLLVINTTRDASLRIAAGSAVTWDIALGPLNESEVSLVIGDYLGEVTDDAFAREVTVRSSGNPLAVVEYLRAVIDAGLIRPDWGRFVLDRAGLDSLPLPEEVLDLIRRRADALSPTAVSVLGVAAVIGRSFDLALLAAATASTGAEIAAATAEAEAHQLAWPTGEGTWSFVHDCVHEALLSTMSAQERTAAHRRIVRVLDTDGTTGTAGADQMAGHDRRYAVARHAIAGEVAAPDLFRLTAAAAAAALAAPAPYEAVTFYLAADTAATRAGIEPDADFEEGFALACVRTVRPADARTHLARALRRQPAPRRRARLYLEWAWVELGEFRYAAMIQYVDLGLAEIGRGIPANPAVMAAVSVGRWVAGMACRWPRTGRGGATGEERELQEIRLRLYEAAILCEWMTGRVGPMLAFMMSAVRPSLRLGSGPEYARGHASFALVATEYRRARTLERSAGWLHELAAETGDQANQATVSLYISGARVCLGRDTTATARDYRDTLRRNARWIDASSFANNYAILVQSLVLRGCFREAWDCLTEMAASVADQSLMRDLETVQAMLARILGYPPVPHPGLAALDLEPESEKLRRYMICRDVVELEVEDGEFGPAFDAAVAAGDALDLHLLRPPKYFRAFWIAKARGRLEQARATPPGPEREARRKVARRALHDARWTAKYPLFAADLRVLHAIDRQLAGRYQAAIDLLDTAEQMSRECEAPRIRFDTLLERARCLRALNQPDQATTEAELAADLAGRSGWVRRENTVRREFELAERNQWSQAPTGTSAAPTFTRDRRRLDAVLQVSAAAGRETDPKTVAAVVLDEIITILGADRALLLLPDPSERDDGSGPLRPYAARSAEQASAAGQADGSADTNDLADIGVSGPDRLAASRSGLPRFATTVVERVHAENRPLVVTGTDEGAALGSESAVQYGLRSILAAPVPFNDDRCGVIYVDSQIAKGLFDEDDARILVALAKQVGLSLGVAEAARLQALVAAERRQRELAETLRNVTLQATATLSTREILGRVLTAARRVLPFDAAWVLTRVSGATRITSAHGDINKDIVGTDITVPARWPLAAAFDRHEAVTAEDGGNALPGLEGHRAVSWLAAPAPLHRDVEMVVVLASRTPGCYGETRTQVARTVIDQAVIAYQNAQLFEEVQRHAATDQLTGLANRRHFLEQAERAVKSHAATDLPLSAAMMDIDYFKRVNDAYGHSVGDEVLAEIARRIRSSLRGEEILGRIGGEEFAVLMSVPASTATALAERLRAAVAHRPVNTSIGPLDIRLSIGLTHLSPNDTDLRDLLDRADQALYTAKRGGRDQVAVHH